MYMILTEQLHDFLHEKDMSTVANSVKKINKVISQNTQCSKLNQEIQLLRKKNYLVKPINRLKNYFSISLTIESVVIKALFRGVNYFRKKAFSYMFE